jgi:hypothetical protein
MGSRAREAAAEVDRLFRELVPDAIKGSRRRHTATTSKD